MTDVSIIIPTLNAGRSLNATLDTLTGGDGVRDIIVSDGGSRDATLEIARAAGVQIVEGGPGRGPQLRRGADAAMGAWLLFLHADTILDPGWRQAVAHHIAHRPKTAGYFEFALDEDTPPAQRLARAVAWRSRALGLPYGDQGLLISRTLYDAAGGFRDQPLMEDVDLVRRIGKRRLAAIDCRAVTSADRFRRDGYWGRSARNLICLGLYFAGVSPRIIQRVYG